jgi:hypothetical protein
MEDRLGALFEEIKSKAEQEIRAEMEKQMRAESERQMRIDLEKQRVEVEKQRVEIDSLRSIVARVESEKQRVEIDSLRSIVARVESDNAQLKLDNARLFTVLTKVHNDFRILQPLPCEPQTTTTFESLLWIVAKSGYTKEVAPFMNLSKATRECKNLQREMREVRNWGRWRKTQLHYFCMKGMTSSVKRMLDMKSINVEGRPRSDDDEEEEAYGPTCLITAAYGDRLDICRLLIEKGALVNAKDYLGRTALCVAAEKGFLEIVRLLCDHGANIEAFGRGGWRPLHIAACHDHISVVKELVEKRNADINALNDNWCTPLRVARENGKIFIESYLESRRK